MTLKRYASQKSLSSELADTVIKGSKSLVGFSCCRDGLGVS